jgi:hypothetical protein
MKFFALFGLMALTAAPLFAQTEGLLEAKLIHGGQLPDGRPLAALVLQLAPDWKTYWRSPGEGGLPPEFDWSASQNLDGIALLWPIPQLLDVGGMTNIGYHGQLVLPMAITPADPAAAVQLRGQIVLGICKDICVPIEIDLAAQIIPNAPPVPMITQALALQPLPPDQAGVQKCASKTMAIPDGLRLSLRVNIPILAQATLETVVVEHRDASIWISGAKVQRQGDALTAALDLVPPQAKPFDLNPADLRITVLGSHTDGATRAGSAAEWYGCPSEP